jgi:hypothetical protein
MSSCLPIVLVLVVVLVLDGSAESVAGQTSLTFFPLIGRFVPLTVRNRARERERGRLGNITGAVGKGTFRPGPLFPDSRPR